MRRALLAMIVAMVLLGGSGPGATAAQHIDQSPGIERGVARFWIAPMTMTETVTFTEFNELGTPISETTTTSTPEASPLPGDSAGTVFLGIIAFRFDTAPNAETGYASLSADVGETARRDPAFATATEVPLTGVGEAAHAIVATGIQDGVELGFAYAVVLDGRYVYALQGSFARLDPGSEIERLAPMLADAEAGAEPETFRPDGSSTGGIWEKLNAVTPVLAPGSEVSDAEIYPDPSGNVDTGDTTDNGPLLNRSQLAALDGIESANGRAWGDAAAGGEGVFAITAWVITFDSAADAAIAADTLANALAGDLTVRAYAAQSDDAAGTLVLTGHIVNPEVQPGSGVVHLTRQDHTIIAAVAYSTGGDATAAAAAAAVVDAIGARAPAEAPAVFDPGGTSTGGVWAQFPESGNPVLHGLLPSIDMSPLDG